MKIKFSKKLRLLNGINFFIYPILFLLVGFSIFYFTLSPILNPMMDAVDLISLPEPPNFNKEENNIFSPTSTENIVVPSAGDGFAKIVIPSISVDNIVYYGDKPALLRKGIGCYTGGYIPGQGRTVLLAGHNHTHFKTLKDIKLDDIINITTDYGEYVYKVTETKIAKDSDTTAYDLKKKEENLILYTCYPFNSYGYTPTRFFVYAKFISGPQDIS